MKDYNENLIYYIFPDYVSEIKHINVYGIRMSFLGFGSLKYDLLRMICVLKEI